MAGAASEGKLRLFLPGQRHSFLHMQESRSRRRENGEATRIQNPGFATRSPLKMAAKVAFAAVAVMLLATWHLAAAAPLTAPAFLWAPENYGSDEPKEAVHYQTTSPASLAKSVLDEGGWSKLVCSREGSHKNVDIAVVFLGSKLQSSDMSKDKQVDPSLADTLKMMINWRVHCYLGLLRIVTVTSKETTSHTQIRVQ